VLLAGLSTGHQIGLGVMAAIFIAFALISSFVIPRRYPDFPGRTGLSVFIIASLVLFAGMLSAVEAFGSESEASKEGLVKVPAKVAQRTFQVEEKEFTIVLPPAAKRRLQPGSYAFQVHNVGALAHDFAVQPVNSHKVSKTKLIQPGGTTTLVVTLPKGVYDVYCTVPGHRQAGMQAKLTVG
jgi:plastocyanin